MQNLQTQFQTPTSHKENAFYRFFIAFLKLGRNLEHFQKKDEYPSVIISEIIDSQSRSYLKF